MSIPNEQDFKRSLKSAVIFYAVSAIVAITVLTVNSLA